MLQKPGLRAIDFIQLECDRQTVSYINMKASRHDFGTLCGNPFQQDMNQQQIYQNLVSLPTFIKNIKLSKHENFVSFTLVSNSFKHHETSFDTPKVIEPFILKNKDIFGIGLNFLSNSLFITLNGRISLEQKVDSFYFNGPIFPVISLHGSGTKIKIEINDPIFNLKAYEEVKYKERTQKMSKRNIPSSELVELVADFLDTRGYASTLKKFKQAVLQKQAVHEEKKDFYLFLSNLENLICTNNFTVAKKVLVERNLHLKSRTGTSKAANEQETRNLVKCFELLEVLEFSYVCDDKGLEVGLAFGLQHRNSVLTWDAANLILKEDTKYFRNQAVQELKEKLLAAAGFAAKSKIELDLIKFKEDFKIHKDTIAGYGTF
eukprot:maker-scaffold_5-snap-gene-15.2-mRNA-1 protein AED:0.22 eAED:0.22 QI:94/0.5/0.4/1/0.25/0.2/5/317/375